MNLANGYVEDFGDPTCSSFEHEAASGFRLPREGEIEGTTRSFIASIGLAPGCRDTRNRSNVASYKSANTDVLAFIAEAAGHRPMLSLMADLADAAGFEGCLHAACDRAGYAMPDGRFSLTIRDLARFGALFARRGRGVDGQPFGSEGFIERTLASGVPLGAPDSRIRYSNSAFTNGRWLGHGGWGGQFLLTDLQTGAVCAFLSVLEDRDAYVEEYYGSVIRMLEDIAAQG